MGQGFRAVFVNHTHPDEKHVSALRMASFARALSHKGHQIVLVCETLGDTDETITDLKASLAAHDFSSPFVLACRPTPTMLLARARIGKLPIGLRQMVLAGSYLLNSGVFTDWRNSARAHIPALTKEFRPDIVWGTFGNTDVWNIAQAIAGTASCPWVADIKDPWSRFLPSGLARLIAGRYRDAAHMTAFSDDHAEEASQFFSQTKTTIYSGFEPCALSRPTDGPFQMLLTGSVYDDRSLGILLDGLAMWLRKQSINDAVFAYAGNDIDRVERQIHRLDGLARVDLNPFMPMVELNDRQRLAHVNAYIHNPHCLFQHKTLELLAAGRPVISVPGEGNEAKKIARNIGGLLLTPSTPVTPEAVADALAQTTNDTPVADPDNLNAYSWPRQADKLETLFERIIGETP
ncbi:MAG: hypothetical protein HOL37_06425 [Rhodospirillaceae bacterium]|nr:hypothetical protein [Rhodospirillaceae bacterium]MBT4219615.1 hypothetical protein [Rhodospirillaceae bacterium]MBT4464909.1 hypothetical protein [Rhodospirillaceae bacterium]MBT5308952.1 hypothetical protein [Rhodospirillaceae bacterium]